MKMVKIFLFITIELNVSSSIEPVDVFKWFLKDYMEEKHLKKLTILKDHYEISRDENLLSINKILFNFLSRRSTIYCKFLYFSRDQNKSLILSSNLLKSGYHDNGDELIVASFLTQNDLNNLAKEFHIISNQHLFWLIVTDKESADGFINKLPLRADNLAVFVTVNMKSTSVMIYDYYKTVPAGSIHKTLISVWEMHSSEREVEVLKKQFGFKLRNFNIWKTRNNFSEVVIRYVVAKNAYFLISTESPDDPDEVEGPFMEIFIYLQEILKFKTEYMESLNNIYGVYDAQTNSWSGIVNDVIQRRSDIALADLDITPERYNAIDFLTELDNDPRLLIYKSSKRSSASAWSQYLKEFSYSSWMMILFTYIVLILCFKFINYFSPEESLCSYSDAFLAITSVFCNFGSEYQFRGYPGRIFMKTILLCSFILFSYYTSLLFTFLTFDIQQPLFTDLEGLHANKQRFKILIRRDTSYIEFLKYSKDSTIQNIWKQMRYTEEEENLPNSSEEEMKIVSQGGVALLTSEKTVALQPDFGFLVFVQPMTTAISWGIPKQYPFKNILNYYIQRYIEAGCYRRSTTRHLQTLRFNLTSKVSESPWLPFDMKDMYFVFSFLGSGCLLALIILVVEIVYKKWLAGAVLSY